VPSERVPGCRGPSDVEGSRQLEVRRLGTVPYHAALQLQRELVEERRADRVPDLLLLLQHPSVITLGVKRDGGRSNVLATPERLVELGIDVSETGRGGDATTAPDRSSVTRSSTCNPIAATYTATSGTSRT